MEEIITIELFGQKYSFKADSGVESAGEIADLLTAEVEMVERQVSNQTFGMDKLTILALAALNISSEYVELKRKHAELIDRINERSNSIVHKINAEFK